MLTQHGFQKTKNVSLFTDFLRNHLYMHKSNTNFKKIFKIHHKYSQDNHYLYDFHSKIIGHGVIIFPDSPLLR